MTIILIINNNSGNTEEHMHINSVKRFGPETKPRGSDAGNKVEGDKKVAQQIFILTLNKAN